MPIYEYKCQKCDSIFELLQKVTEKPLKTCKLCGGEVKRVFHPVGVIFKGSGFYTTDYKRKPTKEEKPKKKIKETCEPKSCDKAKNCPSAS